MEKLIGKYGYRVPELIEKSLAGDVYSMAILALMGIEVISRLTGK